MPNFEIKYQYIIKKVEIEYILQNSKVKKNFSNKQIILNLVKEVNVYFEDR